MRKGQTLKGRTLYIPPMTYSGAYLLTACFRSVGIDAKVTPKSNARTLELGGKYSSGDECYPEKVTLGDFLRVTEMEGYRPEKTAFLMATAGGPCRFGQYCHFMRKVLDDTGNQDAMIYTMNSENGYEGLGEFAVKLQKLGWMAILASDIIRKLTLKTRPYELNGGDTDRLYEDSLESLAAILENQSYSARAVKKHMRQELLRIRDKFRGLPADYSEPKPLIGIVGEIFCRLNVFSNEHMIRAIESQGAETWMADVTEWLWYTNFSHKKDILLHKGKYNLNMLKVILKQSYQHHTEKYFIDLFAEDFEGYEEPEVEDVLEKSHPYLPYNGVVGEMVLSTGKSIYMYYKGVDGIVDISPFTCMNGIVSEALYPKISGDHENIPMRVFYFDGTQSDLERDIGIFMELAQTYHDRKTKHRKLSFMFNQ